MQRGFKEIHVWHFIIITIINNKGLPVWTSATSKAMKGGERHKNQKTEPRISFASSQWGTLDRLWDTWHQQGPDFCSGSCILFPPGRALPGCSSCSFPSRLLLDLPHWALPLYPVCQASPYTKLINIDCTNYSYSPVWHIRLNVMVILKVENVEFYITCSLNAVN